MALSFEDKKAVVAQVHEVANKSVSLLAADYRGLTVSEMTELRRDARNAGVHMQVVRNTLAKRAFEDTDYATFSDTLVGPMILVFSQEDPGAGARLVRDFIKKHKKLDVKALSLQGQMFGADKLKEVADLPTYDQAVAMLLSVMEAPVGKLVRTMAETYSKLVRVVAAVRDQKQ